MILPDVNVLVYAFRDDAVHHLSCRAWLQRVAFGEARFGISPLALSALVRVVTDRRIHPKPTPVADALAFCDAIRAQPNCQLVEPGERHWAIFRDLCILTGRVGRHTTDTWYAALAIEWGCEWVTLDSDFARFPGLRVSSPE